MNSTPNSISSTVVVSVSDVNMLDMIPVIHIINTTTGSMYFISVVHVFPSFRNVAFLLILASMSSIPYIQAMSIISMITFRTTPKLLANVSNIPSSVDPMDVPNISDISIPSIHVIVTLFDLLKLNFSLIASAIGSITDIFDVNPANNRHKKNNGPIIYPNIPIALKICGNTMNASPVPCVTSWSIGMLFVVLINPSILNTPIAVNNSNEQLLIATIRAFFGMFVSSGR